MRAVILGLLAAASVAAAHPDKLFELARKAELALKAGDEKGALAGADRAVADHPTTDTNDVENAVWHYLCNARAHGRDRARKEILKIGKDGRVPMMTVYALFKGEAKPQDVLKDAEAGEAPDVVRKRQLFYAHL